MDAAGGTLPIRSFRLPALARRSWHYLIGQTLTCIVATAAVLLTARRLAGALLTPLSANALIVVALVFCAAAIGAVYLRRDLPADTAKIARKLQRSILGLSLLAVAISLSLPGSSPLGVTAMWLAIVGSEFLLWKLPMQHSMQVKSNAFSQIVSLVSDRFTNLQEHISVDPEDSRSNATQTLKYQQMEGGLSVEGWLRVDFAVGQRTAVVHVAFCPAFLQPPAVETEFEDGPECEIRPSLVIPWGVKWEVKLDQAAAKPSTVRFAFQAVECRPASPRS